MIPSTMFVLDEPLSNLDPLSRAQVREELKRIHGEIDAPTLYVTHNLPEAMAMGDRLAVLHRGAIQQIGHPRDVHARPANDFVAACLRSAEMPTRPA